MFITTFKCLIIMSTNLQIANRSLKNYAIDKKSSFMGFIYSTFTTIIGRLFHFSSIYSFKNSEKPIERV